MGLGTHVSLLVACGFLSGFCWHSDFCNSWLKSEVSGFHCDDPPTPLTAEIAAFPALLIPCTQSLNCCQGSPGVRRGKNTLKCLDFIGSFSWCLCSTGSVGDVWDTEPQESSTSDQPDSGNGTGMGLDEFCL